MELFSDENKIRVTGNGEPWFCSKDVCNALLYGSTAILKHLDDDCKSIKPLETNSRGVRDTRVVSEKGLFKLMLWQTNKDFLLRTWMLRKFMPEILNNQKFEGEIPEPVKVEINAYIKLLEPILGKKITHDEFMFRLWINAFDFIAGWKQLKEIKNYQ